MVFACHVDAPATKLASKTCAVQFPSATIVGACEILGELVGVALGLTVGLPLGCDEGNTEGCIVG